MENSTRPKRLIIGMSGASGAPLTVALLKRLGECCPDVETHLVATRGALATLEAETDLAVDDLRALATVWHDGDAIGASIASGSFRTMGMVVIPCSMKTAAGIASGYSDNLLLRAADVCLKERRRLVLVARESPLSTVHLHNLYQASQLGAVILSPVPAYYRGPRTIDDVNDQVIRRVLGLFDLDEDAYEWQGTEEAQ